MLKALELAGFKSFADKTRFEFHEGITVVVGPNGSGKSNVVDAIKWVLGSQSAKSLRGSEMTDVIFNGSGSRGALNTAEVTLILDNADGVYGGSSQGREVSITRRVYRSGEGEYLINGAACRLRDIRDLLAGTGIGTEAYSIIEQGKVDALLQASPRDRRAIFEEAAGISRFRAKRQDAARRLARVEQNLLRLSDIVDEVESRLRSVRMQAGKAQRYRDGVKRLKELRTEIGIADWYRLTSRIDTVATELSTFTNEDSSRRDWIEAAERELPELEQQVRKVQANAEQLDRRVGELREHAVSTQATLSGLAARRNDVQASVAALEKQWRAASAATSGEAADQPSIAANLAAARSQYEEVTRQLADETERRQVHQTRVERLSAQAEELSRRTTTASSRLELTVQKLHAIQQREGDLTQQVTSTLQERDEAQRQCDTLQAQVEQLQRESDVMAQNCTQSEEHLATTRQALAEHEARLEKLRRDHQREETELQTLRHRIELIAELDREQVVTGQQVRNFVSEELGFQPVKVADVLHVDVDTAPLIEAALGTLAEYVVVPSSNKLLSHPERLPAGAKLMRLDWRTPMAAIDQVNLTGETGVWGRADQFVDSAVEYQPLVRRLLGRTWIVDKLETAYRLAVATGHGLHFVTADGDVLGADGTLVTGRRDQARSSFTRRQNLDQLQKQVAERTPQVAALSEKLASCESAMQKHRGKVEEALGEHREAFAQASKVREQLAAAGSQLQVLSQRAQSLAVSQADVQQEVERLATEVSTTQASIETIRQQRTQLEATCDTLNEQLSLATRDYESSRDRASQLEVSAGKLEHQVELLQVTARQSASESKGSEIRTEIGTQRRRLEERGREIERQQLEATAALAELATQLEQIVPQRDECLAHRRQLEQARDTINTKLQAARRHMDDTTTRRSQLEVSLGKLEHQRQALVDRLREDYEIDLEAEAATAPAERPELDRKQLEQEVNQIRDGLHRIGAVNVDALEELEEIETRFEAISAQYNDLSQAKASLERLMAKLNTESRQLFLSTVETVRVHFQELFRRLFGGGDADILLEEYESDDALDCGVEIRASPPGKETRTISLLSGGEKTLTCVALLLAMFRSKPSPFCVLDEVDAALDEANIGRFTGVLSDFLSSTQFVVITHSKKTMTGADTLYGVTMQESGISKQVSVRFDDVTEDGFIKPSAASRDEPPALPRAA